MPTNETPPVISKDKLISPSSINSSEDIATNPESFRGFLLAAYKSIAATARSLKITRFMIITYVLLLVVAPPIIIMIAFLAFPAQTAEFFKFQSAAKLSLVQNPNSQVLGASTENKGNVLGNYVAALLEPQAAATVQALKVVSPQTVSDVVLPSDQSNLQTPGPPGTQGPVGQPGEAGQTGSAGEIGASGPKGETGSQGAAGKDGAKGDTGATGVQGTTGATGSVGSLTTGSGLTGSVTSGNLSLNLDTNVPTSTTNDINLTGAIASNVLTLSWSGQLATSRGGTGVTSTPSNGQLLIGNGTGYTLSALTAGSNIQITNGSGTISLATSSTPTFTTINGLTITNNGINTLNITAGKTLAVSNTITFGGTDSTSFTLPSSSDTLVGRTSTDTLTNKTISASSNTISGLTNSNLSGTAGITNANLANSSLTVTAGTGLSGGGAVSLGGSVSLTNAGVTSLTGTSNQVNVSGSTGAVTLSLPQNIHTAASPTFAGLTLSALTNCGALSTNSSGVAVCDGATGDSATFSDTTPATIADNDTTELFNDATKPSITPDIATQTILVNVHMSFTGGGGADTYPAIRIVRNNGSSASCSTSGQVGDTFGTFMTSADRADAMATFLDSPATTGAVFYTVCSSINSTLGSTPVSNRIDVTLVELGADLAENYYTKDDAIEPGDVVTIDSSLPAGVKKSNKPYDNQIIGVISTNPGKILDDAIGLNFGRAVPVALSGRVPVKVITENGTIKYGDPLTSSATSGVAMKATKSGSIIGTAMGTYEGSGVGEVLMFVKNSSYNGTRIANVVDSGLEVKTGQSLGQAVLSQLISQKSFEAQTVNFSEIVTDRVVAGLEIISPKITSKDIEVNGQIIIIDSSGKEMIKLDGAGIEIGGTNFLDYLIAWLAKASNNIADFFANRVHTKTLCLGEEKDETCITKSQLDQIILKTNQSGIVESNKNETSVSTGSADITETSEQESTASASPL